MKITVKELIIFFLGALIAVAISLRFNFGEFFNKQFNRINSRATQENRACNFERSIQNAKKSVVKIVGDNSVGSGFLVTSDGYVVTNQHVVLGETSPHVVFDDGRSYLGKVIGTDKIIDLAVIKIVDNAEFQPVEWGNSDSLTQGSNVYALGYPWANELKGEMSVTQGVYSAKRKSDDGVVELIQTDASLNQGNSGGPLINSCGQVVGISVATIEDTQGLSFAISQKNAQSLTKTLIENPNIDTVELALSNEEIKQQGLMPIETVYLFYSFISLRQLDDAYALLSTNYQSSNPLDGWMSGYNNTINVFVNDITESDVTKPTIYVNFTSVDLSGDKTLIKQWEGEWYLIKENNEWKLDTPFINPMK